LDSAIRQRKSNLIWIARALDYGSGHRGVERLRALVSSNSGEDEITDSVLESFAMELGLASGRKPRLHWRICHGSRFIAEVDFAWPEVRLCLELDGWKHHGTRAAFTRDRARDRTLFGLGWAVLRYTWQDVMNDRQRAIDELARAYDVCTTRAAAFRNGASEVSPSELAFPSARRGAIPIIPPT
jgi:hypothetical protein